MTLPLANIFQPLIDAASWAIVFMHDDIGFGWGAAIVGLTFLVRVAVLPLSIKQIRSMRAMQVLQPQLKAIQEKHKEDRERLQRELMNFYRENKINPFASCIPLLMQLPVFLALFYMLRGNSFKGDVCGLDPSGTPIFPCPSNVQDGWLFIESLLEKPVGSELAVLLVLFIGTQMASGLVMSARVEGTQRAIMFILPLAIAPFIISQPAGLAVYWIATNIWTLGQQAVVMRVAPPPEVPTIEEIEAAKPPPPPPRKKKKRTGRRG